MKISYSSSSSDTTYLDESYQNEFKINISREGNLSPNICHSGSFICRCIQDCGYDVNPIIIYRKNSKETKLSYIRGLSRYELTKGYGISYLSTYSLGPSAAVGQDYTRR